MKSTYVFVRVYVCMYVCIYIYIYSKNTILNVMLFISVKNTPYDVDQIHLICSFLLWTSRYQDTSYIVSLILT